MGEILQFPKDRQNQIQIEKQIKVMADALKEIYDAMRKVEMGQKQLQEQANDMELTYQALVKLYATIVGAENVPIDILEYCIYVGMERDPKTGTIKHTASAYLTFVSLSESGSPSRIEPVVPETDIEKKRFKDGEYRYIQRRKRLG